MQILYNDEALGYDMCSLNTVDWYLKSDMTKNIPK